MGGSAESESACGLLTLIVTFCGGGETGGLAAFFGPRQVKERGVGGGGGGGGGCVCVCVRACVNVCQWMYVWVGVKGWSSITLRNRAL